MRKANLYIPGITIEDVDIKDPPPEEMQARAIPDYPGEHNFVRWPAMDNATHVAYRLETAAAAVIVAQLKAKAKAALDNGTGHA
jgi:hypothetical protein